MAKKTYTPTTAAIDVEAIFKLLEGRWTLVILFHLFGGQVQRFSDLEKLIPGISQKMLAQQLRQLEQDGIVTRTVYHQVPPKGGLPPDRLGPDAVPGTRCPAQMGGVSRRLPVRGIKRSCIDGIAPHRLKEVGLGRGST